ncbi:hypothetical protein LCGC14_2791950, partial [marine sediment metagenome]
MLRIVTTLTFVLAAATGAHAHLSLAAEGGFGSTGRLLSTRFPTSAAVIHTVSDGVSSDGVSSDGAST